MKSDRSVAIILGIISSLFFALSFILNRLMSLAGGSWLWASSLRFLFMIPMLLVVVASRKNLGMLWAYMKREPVKWLLWSTIGFGVFYAPLTYAASYGPSWLVASTWQITIVAGMLIAPLLEPKGRRHRISARAFLFSLIILAGVAIMQIKQADAMTVTEMLNGTIPVIIAAFAYPLGNRMMMKITRGELDGFQRTLGMTLASTPFWLVLAVVGYCTVGLPSAELAGQTFIVGLTAGVIATSMFFKATDKATHDQKLLAAVEATQAGEVLFAVAGEIVVLNGSMPDGWSIAGMVLVTFGMILHSIQPKE